MPLSPKTNLPPQHITNQELQQVHPELTLQKAWQLAEQVKEALLKELYLTPKPGLVDLRNCGAHLDMNVQTFLNSIDAITKWFSHFYLLGKSHPDTPAQDFLPKIRPAGIACENEMFQATNNINTHKGGIFAFGLLCSAIGRLDGREQKTSITSICNEVSAMCHHIVQNELNQKTTTNTQGEKLFDQYGVTGARGEAASGYLTIRKIALPVYIPLRQQGCSEQTALLQTLLHLMAHNADTNILARGGQKGLDLVQKHAKNLLEKDGIFHPDGIHQLQLFDDLLIEQHLSPGGSADLLATTWFLAQYPQS